VVTAGEELHREVIEVLGAAKAERASTTPSVEAAIQTCDTEAKSLAGVIEQLESLRSGIWASGGKNVTPAS
jgi:hypothetical protein